MRLIKRWGIVLLGHVSLTLFLLSLEWVIPFPQLGQPIGPLSSANPLIGLGATLLLGLLLGFVWGSLVTMDDRFLGVIVGYAVLLMGSLSLVWISDWGWMGYLSVNEPLGYFVRNMTQRTLADQVIFGLGALSGPLGLGFGLRSALRLNQKKRQSED